MKILEGLNAWLILSSAGLITIVLKGIFLLKPNWKLEPNIKLTVILLTTSVVTFLYVSLNSELYNYVWQEYAISLIVIWSCAIVFYFLLSKWFIDWIANLSKSLIEKFTIK